MANSGQVVISDDYIYCTICLVIYDTPRTLPCLHSFCMECLKGYILKIKEKTGTQQLFCPICRADTKTDNVKFKQLDKWVEYFPINFTLLSILKERKMTMNPKENDCEACLREDIKVDTTVYCHDCSEKLCEDCKRHHKKNKLSTNHRLIDTGNYDFAVFEYLANLTKCPKHETREVKYLCKDHDQLCCNECANVTHRKCKDIVSLAEEVKEKAENDEYNVQKRLDTVESYVENLIRHETTYLANIYTKENEVKECLKNLKAKLNAAYNKLEQGIMLKLSDKKQALLKASFLQSESVEKLKEDMKEVGQKIKKATTMGTNLHVFLLEREMCKQVTQYEETFTTLGGKSSKAAITLSEASSLEEVVRKVEYLYKIEEIDVEQQLPTVSQTKDLKNKKFGLEREISLNDDQPRYCLWIVNYIVVSFEYTSKLVAYRADNCSMLTTYQCSSPTSITATNNNEFAVALPPSNKISIIKIENNQIVCLRRIACLTLDLIAFNAKDKHFLTLSKSESVLRKIALDGKYAGCIDLRRMKKSYIQSTLNLFIDHQYGHIFISSFYQNKLLCIDMSGNELFQYDIDYPWSVIIDSQGNVYVASFNNHRIQQLSPNGQFMKADILRDDIVNQPMAMSFNKEMNKLVITCNDRQGKMKIYNFQ